MGGKLHRGKKGGGRGARAAGAHQESHGGVGDGGGGMETPESVRRATAMGEEVEDEGDDCGPPGTIPSAGRESRRRRSRRRRRLAPGRPASTARCEMAAAAETRDG